MKIGELFFQLGFNADTMKLKDFGKAVSELNMTSILTAGSFGAVYEGAKALVGIADDMALGINKFGRETGQSTQEIQKWTKMAEQMGVSTSVVTGTVAGLEDRLFKMKFTGEGSNIWAMLGLDPRNTTNMFQVLTMLRDKLKNLSTEQQRFFLEQLGISTEMLNVFKLTDAQWADIAKQQTLSGQQLDQMGEYHKELIQQGQQLKMIFEDLGVALMPAIKGVVEILNNFDSIVLKSWEFKGVIDSIAEVMGHIAHPLQTLGEGARSLPKLLTNLSEGYLDAPDKGMSPSLALGPATRPVNVTVKNTVHTSDPETTINTSSDHGQLSSTVRNIVNQKPAGQS